MTRLETCLWLTACALGVSFLAVLVTGEVPL
jgi:hypothetical protein